MAPFRTLLGLALASLALCALAPAQYLTAYSVHATSDADPAKTETRYGNPDVDAVPLLLDHTETFTYGGSTFTSLARASVDYGRIGLYASTVVENRLDSAERNETRASGTFMDPLTISGGGLGATLHAEFRLHGEVDIDPLRSGYRYYDYLHFMVYNESTGFWDDAEGETLTYQNDSGAFTIDTRAIVDLAGYDPARRYALVASAEVGSSLDVAYDDSTARSIVDAEHTAEVTRIGFVSPNGLYGRFIGSTGFRYDANPAPVPEPASWAALGLGALALLRRRRG